MPLTASLEQNQKLQLFQGFHFSISMKNRELYNSEKSLNSSCLLPIHSVSSFLSSLRLSRFILYLLFLFMHVCTRSSVFRAQLQCLLRSTKLLSVYTCIIIVPFFLQFIYNPHRYFIINSIFAMFSFHSKIKVSRG